jgi:hypothetical protein
LGWLERRPLPLYL